MQAEDYRKVPEVGVTNPTIDVLRAHRTIRKFEDSPLSVQDRDALIDVARRAPTSSFRQQFSIIHVTDVALRDQLAEVAQQPYVAPPRATFSCSSLTCTEMRVSVKKPGWISLPCSGPTSSLLQWKTRSLLHITWKLPPNRWAWARSTSVLF